MPVYGKAEYALFNRLMRHAIRESASLNSKVTFTTMADRWNGQAQGDDNKILKKLEVHLARHYKRWRRNQSKREAISKLDLKRLINALQHSSPIDGMVTENNVDIEFDSLPLDALNPLLDQ